MTDQIVACEREGEGEGGCVMQNTLVITSVCGERHR